LLNSNNTGCNFVKNKETFVGCSDGSTLKVTPLNDDGQVSGYFFERYSSNELVEMLAKTDVFSEFSKQYDDFRTSMLELLLTYRSMTEKKSSKTSETNHEKFFAGTVNTVSLLKILSNNTPTNTFDLYVPLSSCCGAFQTLSDKTDFTLKAEMCQGLYVNAHRSSFEYVLINLLLNAYGYCNAEHKEITLKAFRRNSDVIIEVSDNGSNADLEYIKSFQTAYAALKPKTDGEGLGISMTRIFADKYNANLEFEHSETGGLCVRLTLPYCSPDNRIFLFSDNFRTDRCSERTLSEMLKKFFSPEIINNMIAEKNS
jgi:hypothetical protein